MCVCVWSDACQFGHWALNTIMSRYSIWNLHSCWLLANDEYSKYDHWTYLILLSRCSHTMYISAIHLTPHTSIPAAFPSNRRKYIIIIIIIHFCAVVGKSKLFQCPKCNGCNFKVYNIQLYIVHNIINCIQSTAIYISKRNRCFASNYDIRLIQVIQCFLLGPHYFKQLWKTFFHSF